MLYFPVTMNFLLTPAVLTGSDLSLGVQRTNQPDAKKNLHLVSVSVHQRVFPSCSLQCIFIFYFYLHRGQSASPIPARPEHSARPKSFHESNEEQEEAAAKVEEERMEEVSKGQMMRGRRRGEAGARQGRATSKRQPGRDACHLTPERSRHLGAPIVSRTINIG